MFDAVCVCCRDIGDGIHLVSASTQQPRREDTGPAWRLLLAGPRPRQDIAASTSQQPRSSWTVVQTPNIMSDGNYSQVTEIQSSCIYLNSFLFQYNIDGTSVNEETVSHLRQRLNVMREICKVSYTKYWMLLVYQSGRVWQMADIYLNSNRCNCYHQINLGSFLLVQVVAVMIT